MAIFEGITDNFHQQFASWARIEPRSRSDDWSDGLQARSADPLWMLARQWQFGELDGEDAGSPIAVDLRHSIQTPSHIILGEDEDRQPFPAMPLETMVERDRAPLTWRLRVQIGQQFERFLRSEMGDAAQAGTRINALRSNPKYALIAPTGRAAAEIDEPTGRYLRFMAGRVIDGEPLLNAIQSGSFVPTARAEHGAAERLTKWYGALFSQPEKGAPRAWRNEQLDHRFEINPPNDPDAPNSRNDKTHLIAPDYRNGDLDWYSFSAKSGIRGRWQTPGGKKTYPLPTRISAGGTSPRWWAFESAATDFGAIDVAAPDLARLLLMEFVLVYGDDWYSVPLTVPMPSLVKIDSLRVRNVFGEELPIEPVREVVRRDVERLGGDADDPQLRWELFTLVPYPDAGDAPGIGNALFIPPVAAFREESKPLEAVHFLRDEGANRVWGVEQTVMNGVGKPVNGFDAQRTRLERLIASELTVLKEELATREQILGLAGLTDAQRDIIKPEADELRIRIGLLGEQQPSSEIPSYRLITSVPENWIPFSPVRAKPYFGFDELYEDHQIMLRRAQMVRNVDGLAPVPVPALTNLLSLSAEPSLSLIDESAVPRAGQRLQLTAQRVRWVDGKTYVWLGRKVLTGRGEGSSGLRFDVIERGAK